MGGSASSCRRPAKSGYALTDTKVTAITPLRPLGQVGEAKEDRAAKGGQGCDKVDSGPAVGKAKEDRGPTFHPGWANWFEKKSGNLFIQTDAPKTCIVGYCIDLLIALPYTVNYLPAIIPGSAILLNHIRSCQPIFRGALFERRARVGCLLLLA
jgi:hypothetical protein